MSAMTFGKIGTKPLFKHWTAHDYVQDGLVAMWDGIENAGWGVHNQNATSWKDLVGNRNIPLTSSGAWTDDSLIRANSNNMYGAAVADNTLKIPITETMTFEIVFYLTSQSGNRSVIASPFSIKSATLVDFVASQMNGQYYLPDGSGRSSRAKYIDYGKKYSISTTIDTTGVVLNMTANGAEVTTFSGNSISYGNMYFAFLGGRASNTIAYGGIYNLRIYSRALTVDEITHNYAVDKLRFNLL